MAVTEATNTKYDSNVRDWKLIHRMLTGEDVQTTLVQGAYEPEHIFKRRKKRADWKAYTRDLISRLTGELFVQGGEVSRSTPVSNEFLSDIGPEGESYKVQLINLAETLVAYHEAWVLMDPSVGLQIVEPQHVPRWNSEAVVLQGQRPVASGIKQDQQTQKTWTIYYNNRFETYVKSDEEGVKERQVDNGFYVDESWAFSDGPPAVHLSLPWKVKFGLAVARAHRSLYQMESKFDEALTNSLGGLIQIATGGDEDLKQEIEKALKGGSIAIPYDKDHGEHQSLNVGIEGLEPGQNTLDRKRKELYRTAHQALDQASKRMSATEANQRTRSGSAAALSILAETMESAEESILDMIAEAEDSRNVKRELTHEVDWPTDYSSAFSKDDEMLLKDVFGSLKVPVDVDTKIEIISQRLEGEGISMNEVVDDNGTTRREAIREKVEQRQSQEAQAQSTQSFDIT